MHLMVETSFPPFRLQGSSEGALIRSRMDVVKTCLMYSAAHKLQGLHIIYFINLNKCIYCTYVISV